MVSNGHFGSRASGLTLNAVVQLSRFVPNGNSLPIMQPASQIEDG